MTIVMDLLPPLEAIDLHVLIQNSVTSYSILYLEDGVLTTKGS